MWLLNATTLQLESFMSELVPQYAILSHTWGKDELVFQDMFNGNATAKEGYKKIELCCNQARKDGYGYAWVDTCCIDKTSSAELTEAINSMFKWYKNSAVCYVHLADVHTNLAANDFDEDTFRASRWFSRGFTLQELLAPLEVQFFNSKMQLLGIRLDLANTISEATGIDVDVLKGAVKPQRYSIAQRMSWAATRHTTRPEDRAYSLLGIFDVNMPLLYGEGSEKAFFRLQKKIIKQSQDNTILAWRAKPQSETAKSGRSGFLARSIDEFEGCGMFKMDTTYQYNSRPTSFSNQGISLTMYLSKDLNNVRDDNFLGYFNCFDAVDNTHVYILLQKPVPEDGASIYCRREPTYLGKLDWEISNQWFQSHAYITAPDPRQGMIYRTSKIHFDTEQGPPVFDCSVSFVTDTKTRLNGRFPPDERVYTAKLISDDSLYTRWVKESGSAAWEPTKDESSSLHIWTVHSCQYLVNKGIFLSFQNSNNAMQLRARTRSAVRSRAPVFALVICSQPLSSRSDFDLRMDRKTREVRKKINAEFVLMIQLRGDIPTPRCEIYAENYLESKVPIKEIEKHFHNSFQKPWTEEYRQRPFDFTEELKCGKYTSYGVSTSIKDVIYTPVPSERENSPGSPATFATRRKFIVSVTVEQRDA